MSSGSKRQRNAPQSSVAQTLREDGISDTDLVFLSGVIHNFEGCWWRAGTVGKCVWSPIALREDSKVCLTVSLSEWAIYWTTDKWNLVRVDSHLAIVAFNSEDLNNIQCVICVDFESSLQ